ncbi:hypothetical protein ACFV29_31240 [Streptomyces sp. NPDC059690]|uniref:protein kinase domain-containing protein n=1 Tax=Streptomyces sp. NPDC059690 TaxID=3346907 RepID=UPI0036AC736C
MVGTPGYLPPEAFLGFAPDVKRDLYSAAVILYELLTGHAPFGEPEMDPLNVARAQVENDVPLPSSINPLLSPECDRILLRALSKDPSERYESAEEMAGAMSVLLNLD